jgi:RimJ/RimL family protein N-acetyltransferase
MFARTERLLLRPPFREDSPALRRAIADEGVLCGPAHASCPCRIEDADAWIARDRGALDHACLIFRRTLGAPRLVGAGGLGRRANGEVECGFWILRPYRGLGFATEAGRALVEFARDRLSLDRLTAGQVADNPAARHVFAKLGFVAAGGMHRLDFSRALDEPVLENVVA